MSFKLQNVVPWGRSFNEYLAMFALSDTDLDRRILGCSDGPAAFNAELTRQGGRIASIDPLYQFSVEDIHARIQETFTAVMEETRNNRHEFIWTTIKSVDELGRIRMAAMERFLEDYPGGAAQGRYIAGQLPSLPFRDAQFDLALCSHFLFLYSEQLTDQFHLASIRELCRVADEVRIFPLLELGSIPSRHLQSVVGQLADEGYQLTILPVFYEFQRNGNQLLSIRR